MPAPWPAASTAAARRAPASAPGCEPRASGGRRPRRPWRRSGEAADPDLAAALAFARRRRLGPFRPQGERAARRLKDLAALARQGFAADLARRIVDAEDLEELEQEAGGAL